MLLCHSSPHKKTAMSKTINTLYVVTGVSRLTGERESVSRPNKWPVACHMCNKWKSKPARKRDYLRLRVKPYNPVINFKNKE